MTPRPMLILTSTDGRTTRYLYARSTPMITHKGALVSARSKSKDTACSGAASAWRTGKASPETFKTLAACRAKAKARGSAAQHRAAGNEGKAQVLEHRASTGKVGAEHRRALAEGLHHIRKGKQIARVAHSLDTTPMDPIEAGRKQAANRARFLADAKERGPKRPIKVKRPTAVHKDAVVAVANALDERHRAESAGLHTADQEIRGMMFRQAGQKYRTAQDKLKALRTETRQKAAVAVSAIPASKRSSEEFTGHAGPTRSEDPEAMAPVIRAKVAASAPTARAASPAPTAPATRPTPMTPPPIPASRYGQLTRIMMKLGAREQNHSVARAIYKDVKAKGEAHARNGIKSPSSDPAAIAKAAKGIADEETRLDRIQRHRRKIMARLEARLAAKTAH